MSPSTPRPPRGFTLIELLVVIGIIALLISILVPTAIYVKEQGYKARTTAQLNNIRAAVEAYHGTFQSYPGPLSEVQMYTHNPPYPGGIAGQQVTGTENLVLGLLGGLKSVGGGITYDPTLVGTGPNAFLQNRLPGKSYSPFIETTTSTLSPIPTGNPSFIFPDGQPAGDTNIPEFLDAYPEPMPILYLRARQSAVATAGYNGIVSENGTLPQQLAQYDMRSIQPYTRANYVLQDASSGPLTRRGLIGMDIPAIGYNPAGNKNGAFNGITYFADPQSVVNNVPKSSRGKDSFILIAAGADRIYGTIDDITSFGSVQAQ